MRLSAERLSLLRARDKERGNATKRLPGWLRAPLPGGERYGRIKQALRQRGLHTVCEEAQCPNIGECWNEGTATLMLMGDTCTRACRFCAVKFANEPPPLDPNEPAHAAEQVALMELDHVVLTSINRDDLDDGGAGHFAATIAAIGQHAPTTLVEVLTPDFQGVERDIATVLDAAPDVFAHNVETVPALQGRIRDRRASWQRSIEVLRFASQHRPEVVTKSSIMLGLGETDSQVDEALCALRQADVDAVTLGQYLRPSPWHHEVVDFISPDIFERWRARCDELGFQYAACGPLVRSSYRAGEFYLRALAERRTVRHSGESDPSAAL